MGTTGSEWRGARLLPWQQGHGFHVTGTWEFGEVTQQMLSKVGMREKNKTKQNGTGGWESSDEAFYTTILGNFICESRYSLLRIYMKISRNAHVYNIYII